MENEKDVLNKKGISLKQQASLILRYKAIRYSLIAGLLLLPATQAFIYNSNNKLNKNEESEQENTNLLTQGTIETEVEPYEPEEDVEYSTYSVGDDYTGAVSNASSDGTSNSVNAVTNMSSLVGTDISILEGEPFNPLQNLNIYATDKDGRNITNRVMFDQSKLDTNKAGDYTVKATVKLNDGYILEKAFNVNVKAVELDVSVASFEANKKEVEKNDKTTLELALNVSKNYVTANSVMINGKEYQVYKSSNIIDTLLKKQKYEVVVSSDEFVGKKEYNLGHIKMSDGTLINTNSTTEIEVLKSKPRIKNFSSKDLKSSEKIYTEFDLEDIDNSVSNLKLNVYRNNKLIETQELDKADNYKKYVSAKDSGFYKFEVVGDVNLYSEGKEEKIKLNERIFSEVIRVKFKDETSLEGENLEILKNYNFDPVKDLKLKATDVDGEDITDKISIDSNTVNINASGKYLVSASIVNKDNEKITKTFEVTVANNSIKEETSNESDNKSEKNKSSKDREETTKSISDENSGVEAASYSVEPTDLETSENSFSRMLGRFAKRTENTISLNNVLGKSTSSTLQGNNNEKLRHAVDVTGIVNKSDGSAPEGMISVEVPTSLAFTVDQKGNLLSGTYSISNKSSSDISVYVSQFVDIEREGGITVKPSEEDLTDLDRSNIHLYLLGDKKVDLGKNIDSDKELVEIPASDSKIVKLTGDAGKGTGVQVDENGANEEFTLVLKIKRKN